MRQERMLIQGLRKEQWMHADHVLVPQVSDFMPEHHSV